MLNALSEGSDSSAKPRKIPPPLSSGKSGGSLRCISQGRLAFQRRFRRLHWYFNFNLYISFSGIIAWQFNPSSHHSSVYKTKLVSSISACFSIFNTPAGLCTISIYRNGRFQGVRSGVFDALVRRRRQKTAKITKAELHDFWLQISDQSFDARLQIFFDMYVCVCGDYLPFHLSLSFPLFHNSWKFDPLPHKHLFIFMLLSSFPVKFSFPVYLDFN